MVRELQVTFVEARNLTNKDIGYNDPYIEAWFNKDYKQRTSGKHNTNDPTWNESMMFNLDGNEDSFHFRVLDTDVLKNDKIGEAKIKLSDTVGTQGTWEGWVNLPKLLGFSSNGEVLIRMSLV